IYTSCAAFGTKWSNVQQNHIIVGQLPEEIINKANSKMLKSCLVILVISFLEPAK
ncbi:MAG: hypothetical protein JWR87_686, partial [Segetibacter sp.]|nr:hypothetical protein [Segetibacter sp.]